MPAKTWYRKPLRIIDQILLDTSAYRKGRFDPKRAASEKRRLGFNAEHFSLRLRGEDVYAQMDALEEYLGRAHEAGLKVFVYYNVHWHDVSDLARHPDWFQVDWRGRVIDDVYGRGLMPCVNSPGWRRHTYEVITELARRGADGVFLDGPVFNPRGCYCRYCRAGFRKQYGAEMPRKGDLGDPRHRLLIEFQQDSLADYLKGAYRAAKSTGRDVALYMNGANPTPNWANGRDNVKLKKYQDLVGAEGGFEYYSLSDSPFFKCGMTAKLLEAQAPEKPRVVFIAAKHSPWNRETLTPAELKLRCAETLANGASYWIGYTCSDKRLEEAMAEVNAWVEQGEEYFEDTHVYAGVGLYWSQDTANLYGGEIPMSDFTGREIRVSRDYMRSFLGAYEALVGTHTPFRIVVGPEQIQGLKLLILPNTACMSREEIAAVEKFVREGGRLIASHEASLYDEKGGRRPDYGLGEVLGLEYLGLEDYGRYENYVEVDGKWLPAYRYVVRARLTTAEPLGRVSENTRGFYQEIRMSPYPGVTENLYGSGRALYFAGDFFATFRRYRFKSYLEFLRETIDRLAAGCRLRLGHSFLVDVALRAKKGLVELHLVNFTSGLARPVHEVAPIHGLRIRLPGVSAAEACTVIDRDAELELREYGGGIELYLSRLREYEVVALEAA